jgi:DNA-binding NarL/FixJ family response regulator
LAGSFELLMTLVRTENRASATPSPSMHVNQPLPVAERDAPAALTEAPSVEQAVRAWHSVGHSQRAIARELNIDRRKVKRIIDRAG